MTPVEQPVLVQTFISEATVERFDVGVLIRFTGLDQTPLHMVCMRPFQHRVPGELLPVVGPDDLGIAAMLADAIENPHQVIATFLRLRRLICRFCSA